MKKTFQTQWYLLFLTLAVALSGWLLRSVQLSTELLPSGALAQGSYLHVVLAVVTIVFLILLALLILPLAQERRWSYIFSASPLPNGLQLLAATMLIVGNAILWMRGTTPVSSIFVQLPDFFLVLSELLPPLGILSGLCIGGFALVCGRGKVPTPLLYMAASLYLILRLIVCFQAWNTDPSIYNYCFQLLAAISSMLAAFQLAGFSFGKGRRRITLFWCLCAVVFCAITVADTFATGTVDDILINLAMLLSMAVSGGQLLFCKKD